jgi:hypothetical protein
MKTNSIKFLVVCATIVVVGFMVMPLFSFREKPCIFKSVMGEQTFETNKKYGKKDFSTAITSAEEWLISAQNNNGGWGAGSRSNQKQMNQHAVETDPASTAISAMALCRLGYNVNNGKYSENLKNAILYLVKEINENKDYEFITKVRKTQIQGKLGQNIDAVLTAQFFNQVMPKIKDETLKNHVIDALQICVDKIENNISENGATKGAGWAGVLQSSFATKSLEDAKAIKGIKVDDKKLEQSKDYLKENYDADKNQAKTTDGAGIVLYSVSGSVNGSANDYKEAKKIIETAKKENKLAANEELNEANLVKAGISETKAKNLATATRVYQASVKEANNENVIKGYGNNGGEEFMSFLQTGEAMKNAEDTNWENWYTGIKSRILDIQNNDGSWNGHHCITSPVFCTATCLLILGMNK